MDTIITLLQPVKEMVSAPIHGLMLTGLTSFFIAFLLIPVIIKVAKRKKLLDHPNGRTEHLTPTPTLGGVAIFAGLLTSILIWGNIIQSVETKCIITALILLFITGLRDDLKEIKASRKLFIQILAAAIVVSGGIKIESLGGMFGIYELPLIAQYLLSIFILVGLTNAINLIDGIDGLAGGIGAMNALVLFVGLLLAKEYTYAAIAIGLAGSLLAFLRYNFNPASIFMGDTGSLVIGFGLALLGIKFLQVANTSPAQSITLIYGVMILPVYDTLRVFSIRLSKGHSPFSPDKNHLHHLLVKTGFDHKKSALIMYSANAILIATAGVLAFLTIEPLVSLATITALAICLSELLTIKRILITAGKIRGILSRKAEREVENHLLTKIHPRI